MMLFFKPASTLRKIKPQPYQSFSESLLLDNIEAAETLTRKWISPGRSSSSSCCSSSCSSCSLFPIFSTDNRTEGRRLIEVINNLQYAIEGVMLVNPESQKLTRAYNVVTVAMKHLEKEFLGILKSNRRNLDPKSVSVRSFNSRRNVSVYSNVPKSEAEEVMTDLKMIADCMISSGYEKECAKIYKKVRKSIIVEALNKFGFENLSFGKIQKLEWERMEKSIKDWLKATKILIGSLFDGERILCDHVFSSSVPVAESCFSEITLDSALTLFIFPVNVAKCRKTSEKIFLTLDLYQTISKLLPHIETVFSYDSTCTVRLQAAKSLEHLGEAINSMFAEFEVSITKESSKSSVPGGGVHQLTRYVMNFIVFLADYNESLAGILTESNLPLPENYFGEDNAGETGRLSSSASSPVTTRFAWLILVLLCKIDTKSRIYNDMALSYIFLANNLQYVISKVRTTNLKVVLGDQWVTNHQGKVSNHLEKYEKIAWKEAMTSLSDKETLLEENAAKEYLKRFNEAVEEAYKKQSTWVVPDTKLREDLKDSVSKKLANATSSFYEKYNVENWDEIVKFDPSYFGNYLSDLYLGTGDSSVNVPSPKPASNMGSSLQSLETGR